MICEATNLSGNTAQSRKIMNKMYKSKQYLSPTMSPALSMSPAKSPAVSVSVSHMLLKPHGKISQVSLSGKIRARKYYIDHNKTHAVKIQPAGRKTIFIGKKQKIIKKNKIQINY